MGSIAIVQTAFIGDVILATPLFEAARRSCPDERIIAVVRSGCENLVENNPFVDTIETWDKRGADRGIVGLIRFAGRLRRLGVTTALIPHRSFRTALALFLSGTQTRIGFAKGGGTFLHSARIPYRTDVHEVDRNLMLAEALDWDMGSVEPSVYPDDSDRNIVTDILTGIEEFCVLAPGSVWATKQWPGEYFAELGSVYAQRGQGVVISGAASDRDVCRFVADGVSGAVNACGKLTLRQSFELYRRARFVLTGDTAPQHLAAAAGTWTFSIFGPTVRDFGFWPYTDRSVVIEESMDCRPCSVHGPRACPIGTHACMRNISPGRIVSVIDEALEREHNQATAET